MQPANDSRKHRNTRRQAGFTLVELVIVILILGILSAVALPRFLNLGIEARQAKLEAIFGSMRAAAQITRAAALVQNGGAAASVASSTVSLDGGTVNTVYGYPAATAAGIVAAAGLDATNDKVTLDTTTTAGTLYVVVNGASTPADCRITYTPPASAGSVPTIALPAGGINCG